MVPYSEERLRAILDLVIGAAVLLDKDIDDQGIHQVIYDGELSCEQHLGERYIGETFVDGPNGPVGVHIQALLDEIDGDLYEMEELFND